MDGYQLNEGELDLFTLPQQTKTVVLSKKTVNARRENGGTQCGELQFFRRR